MARSSLTAEFVVVVVLTIATNMAEAFWTYRDKIPNGYNVADPCAPGRTAQGVGHVSAAGGGPRNDFGTAFAASGREWTSELCRADSDGDGKSNGEELGDPCCTWSQGSTPRRTTGITHPGINEGEPQCLLPPWLWKLFFGWTTIFEQK